MSLRWRRFKASSAGRNLIAYLIFVGIAAIFWAVMVLNESVQMPMEMELRITNKPDSLTFINLPPQKIHFAVRDKGTTLLRTSAARHSAVEFNFREFASDGVFRLTSADLYAALRSRFGAGAQISSLSVDSVRCSYTDIPPKKVPVEIDAQLTTDIGFIVDKRLIPSRKFVLVYAMNAESLDTIKRVRTRRLVKSGMNKTMTFNVGFCGIPGVRIAPASISVKAQVEPLVSRQQKVEIKAVNVPEGENISLFPSVAEVSMFVPMNRFNDPLEPLEVQVDYHDVQAARARSLPVKIAKVPDFAVSPTLNVANVEYILVK